MQSVKSQSPTPSLPSPSHSLHQKMRFLAELKTDIRPLSLLSVIHQLSMYVPCESGILKKILRSSAPDIFKNTQTLLAEGSGSDIEKLIDLHAADDNSALHTLLLSNPNILDRFKKESSDTAKQASNYHDHLLYCLANNPTLSAKLINFVINKINVNKFCFSSSLKSKQHVEKLLGELESKLTTKSDRFTQDLNFIFHLSQSDPKFPHHLSESEFSEVLNLINNIIDAKPFWISCSAAMLDSSHPALPIIDRFAKIVNQVAQYNGNNPEFLSDIQTIQLKLSPLNICFTLPSINIKEIKSKIEALKSDWNNLTDLFEQIDGENEEDFETKKQEILSSNLDQFLNCIKNAHELITSLSQFNFIENYSHPYNHLMSEFDVIFDFASIVEPDSEEPNEVDNKNPQARIFQALTSFNDIKFATPDDYPSINQLITLHSLIKNTNVSFEQLSTFSEILKNFLSLQNLTRNHVHENFEELCIDALVELALHKNSNEGFAINIYKFLHIKGSGINGNLFSKSEPDFSSTVGKIISDSRSPISLKSAAELTPSTNSCFLVPQRHLLSSPHMTLEYLTKNITYHSINNAAKLLKRYGNLLPDILIDSAFQDNQEFRLRFFSATNVSVESKINVYNRNKEKLTAESKLLFEKIIQAFKDYEDAKANNDLYTLKILESFFKNPENNEHLLLSSSDLEADIINSPTNIKINHYLQLNDFNKLTFEDIDNSILETINTNPLEFVQSISENKTVPLKELTHFIDSLVVRINEMLSIKENSSDFFQKIMIFRDLESLTVHCKKVLENHGAKLTSAQVVSLCQAGSAQSDLDREEAGKIFAAKILYQTGFHENVHNAIFEKWGMMYSYMPSGNEGDPYIPKVVSDHIK